jgi:hypothetical protein
MTATLEDAKRFDQPAPGASLGELLRWFFRQPSPIFITAALLGMSALRISLGKWGWWDLLIPIIVVALEPFTEWLIHVFILHFKPKHVGGVRIDPGISRKHRAHHAEPKNLKILFVPWQGLAFGTPLYFGIAVLTMEFRHAVMLETAGLLMLLTYEWTHYLIHAPYRAKTQFFRNRSRNHRLHHFKNEHYWFGVTMKLGDVGRRTVPEERAVELSPTAPTLGVTPAGP